MTRHGQVQRRRQPPPLFGRERERARLLELLDDTLAGHGSLILISGEAGIGKTTLVDDLIHGAEEHGCLVLTGGCYDLTTTPPYGPWVEAMRDYRPVDGGTIHPAWFEDATALREIGSQGALFEEVRRFFAGVAEGQPVVIILEDLHWADTATSEALRYLGRTLSDTAIFLVVTYRNDEIERDHELFALLPLLVRESQAQRIQLNRLDSDAVRHLVESRYVLVSTDVERLVDHVVQRSDGNPFFASEILHGLEAEQILQTRTDVWFLGDLELAPIPDLLHQVLDGRLRQLPPDARSTLQVAAVIGQVVQIDFWRAVAQLDGAAVDLVVIDALNARLIDESRDGAAISFRHALLREALYESLSLSDRRALHCRIGELLEALPSPDPNAVAHHFRQGGDTRAAHWLIRAGVGAEGSYAWRVAADNYEAAQAQIESAPEKANARGWLLLQIAHLLRYSNIYDQKSMGYLEEAHRIASEVNDPLLAATSLSMRGLLHCLDNDVGKGLGKIAEATLTLEGTAPDDQERARQVIASLFPEEIFTNPRMTSGGIVGAVGTIPGIFPMRQTYVMWLAFAGRFLEAIEVGESLIHDVSAATSDVVMIQSACRDAYYGLAEASDALGRPETAREWREQALAAYQRIGHHALVEGVFEEELRHLLTYGPDQVIRRRQIVDAVDAVDAVVQRADPIRISSAQLHAIPLDLIEGRWDQAQDLALSTQGDNSPSQQQVRLEVFGLVGIERDKPELLDPIQADIHGFLLNGPDTIPGEKQFTGSLIAQRLAVRLALDTGDLDTARTWLEAYDRWLNWSGAVIGRAEGHLLWGRYFQLAGALDVARQRVEQAIAQASNPRQPLALLAALRSLGKLDIDQGKLEEAGEHLRASLDLAERCEAPFEQAKTRLVLAELAARSNDPDTAQSLLKAVKAICEPLQAKRTLSRVEQIETLLHSRADYRPAGLSPREVEVLQLVAQGMTDAEVAEQLFLSPRTVSSYLSSVYNKLGVNSRTAAVSWAVREGLLD